MNIITSPARAQLQVQDGVYKRRQIILSSFKSTVNITQRFFIGKPLLFHNIKKWIQVCIVKGLKLCKLFVLYLLIVKSVVKKPSRLLDAIVYSSFCKNNIFMTSENGLHKNQVVL